MKSGTSMMCSGMGLRSERTNAMRLRITSASARCAPRRSRRAPAARSRWPRMATAAGRGWGRSGPSGDPLGEHADDVDGVVGVPEVAVVEGGDPWLRLHWTADPPAPLGVLDHRAQAGRLSGLGGL